MRFPLHSLSKWASMKRIDIDIAVRKTLFDTSRQVILNTPVDTGRARANWQVGVDYVPVGTVSYSGDQGVYAPAPSGGSDYAIQNVKEITEQKILGKVFYFVNNLPYIERLEYGHSDQAAQGMVRIALRQLKTSLLKRLKEASK